MGQEITIRCDQCGRLKQEANHWWMVEHGFREPTCFLLWTSIDIGIFDSGFVKASTLTFCGIPCFQHWQSKRLEELMK